MMLRFRGCCRVLPRPVFPKGKERGGLLRFCFVPCQHQSFWNIHLAGFISVSSGFEYRLASSRRPGCTSHTPRAIGTVGGTAEICGGYFNELVCQLFASR
jgi:hypothetical protein